MFKPLNPLYNQTTETQYDYALNALNAMRRMFPIYRDDQLLMLLLSAASDHVRFEFRPHTLTIKGELTHNTIVFSKLKASIK